MPTPAAVMQVIVTANTAGANSALAATDKQLKKTAATSQAASSRMATAGKASVASLAAIGVISGKVAIDFDKNMRNVNSIAQLPEKSLAKLSDSVRDLGGKTAQSPQTLAEGLYDLVSSGFDAKESMDILEKSATAATAGLTDTATSTKAVAAVLNAYRLPAKKAGDVSDVLFRTVDRGVISFEVLAGSIGNALPASAALGVNVNALGASIATLTKQGQSGESAIVNINAAMTSLFKPTKDMQTSLKTLGYDSAEALIEAKGFQGGLQALIDTTDGTTASVGKLFANVRAQRAVFGLTGKNAEGAAEDLHGLERAAGATDKALSQQSQSVAYMWNKLKAQAEDLAIGIGNELIPTMKDMLDIISDPKLTIDQKVDQVLDKTLDIIQDKGPMFAETGGKVMVAMGKGMVSSFIDANPLGKLFLAATVIRLIGGPGALAKIGMAIATPVWAAFSASTAGTALGVAGLNIASALAKSLTVAIPAAFAAYGIYDIVSGAMTSDTSEQSLYKAGGMAGGAIIGGIAGSFVGNPILGAAIGGGIGEMIGGAVAPATEEAVKHLGKYQQAVKNTMGVFKDMRHATGEVSKARDRDRTAARKLERAEADLKAVRAEYPKNSTPVLRAEMRVAEAKKKSLEASRKLKQAERLEGIERNITKQILKANTREQVQGVIAKEDALRAARQSLIQAKKEGYGLETLQGLLHRVNVLTDQRRKRQGVLNKTLQQSGQQIGPKFAKSLQDIIGKQRKLSQAVTDFDNPLKIGQKSLERSTNNANQFTKQLDRMSRDGTLSVKDLRTALVNAGNIGERSIGDLEDAMGNLDKKGGRSVGSFGDATTDVIKKVESDLNKALKGLSLDPVSFGISGGGTSSGGGGKKPGKSATGATYVPGIQGGDRHLLSLNGVPISYVESGEKIAIVNREAAKHEMALNAAVPRYAEGGVIQQALGPYTMGPIAYDSNHAGGNSHLHLDFYTIAQALAYGHKMQGMGWNISEYTPKGGNPWGFGGISTQHQSPGHYDGTAFDANTAADETQAEVAAVVKLLGGGNVPVGGAMGAMYEKLKELTFNGPDGGLTSLGQGMADKIVAGANAYLKKHAPTGQTSGADYVNVNGTGSVPSILMRTFMGGGLSKIGAAAVTGNAYQESTWNPNSVEGLFGFHSSPVSMGDLANFASKHNASPTDPAVQGNFVLAHLSPTHESFDQGFANQLSAGPLEAATELFMTQWERPNAALGNLARRIQGAKMALGAVGGKRRGGMLSALAKGGLINLDGVIDKTYNAIDPEDGKGPTASQQRKRIAKNLKHKIEKLSELSGGKRIGDYFSQDGSELAGRLAETRENIDMYSEYASNAGSLDKEGAPGVFKGQTETYWLTQELDSLRVLRNYVLEAEAETQKQRAKVADAITRAKDKMHKWFKELNKAKRHLAAEGKTPSDWKKGDLDPVKASIKEWNDLKDKKRLDLMKKFVKQGGKLPGDRLFAEDASILTPESHPTKFPNVKSMGAVMSLLQETVIPGLSEERSQLSTAVNTLKTEIGSIQGAGGPGLPNRYKKHLPALGTLGGEIFQVQSDLQSALESATIAAPTTGDETRASILEQMLREANLRTEVSQRQYGVFAATPVLGAFKDGGTASKSGLYVTSEEGAEVLKLPAGASVRPNNSLSDIGPGPITLIVKGDIITDEKDPFELVVGDKRFPIEVQKVTKQQAKSGGRVLPGRGGS